jgi:hypothetical protein
MASQQSRKSQNKTDPEDEEIESSQDAQLDFLKNARDLMVLVKSNQNSSSNVLANGTTQARKRRDAKRKSVQEEHVKRTKEVAEKINVVFDTRKNRV